MITRAWVLQALLLSVLTEASPAAQYQEPDWVWRIDQVSSNLFQIPVALAVGPEETVFVTDARIPGVVVLRGSDGTHITTIGRAGDGPGEFRSPELVAVSINGQRIAVLDGGRQSIDVFDWRTTTFLQRHPLNPTIIFAKGMAMPNDTAVVITGGSLGREAGAMGVHWIDLHEQGSGYSDNRPEAPPGDLMSRRYASGGPVSAAVDAVIVADASTGDVWMTRPGTASTQLASGPGAPEHLIERMMRGGSEADGKWGPWWDFPRAMMVEPLADGAFLLAYAKPDRDQVIFYRLAGGRSPKFMGAVQLKADAIASLDSTSFLVVGDAGEHGRIVGRVRYPFSRK